MIRKPDETNLNRIQVAIEQLQVVARDLVNEFTVEHLKAAESWNDRFECLKWAVESRATVNEMICWHRAQNGLDLFPPEDIPAVDPDHIHRQTFPPLKGGFETKPEPQVPAIAHPICSCGAPCYINKKGVTEDFCLNCMPF